MRFWSVEQLGPKQSLTPEGYLLCEDVPLARTGEMVYQAHELPQVKPDARGMIVVERRADDVFTPRAIASLQGKPVVDNHPPEKRVNTRNWQARNKGVLLNPRRGDGVGYDNAFLYGDILIQDPDTIQAVRDGKRDVSLGYDAEYEQIKPGRARQYNIVGNHVALVNNGRCGPRCAIGDSAMPDGGMGVLNRVRRARRALSTNDEAGAIAELDKIDEALGQVVSGDEDPNGGARHHITVNVNGGQPSGAHMPGAVGDRRPRRSTRDADPDNGNGGDPNGGGDPVQQLMERMDRLEQAISILAEAIDPDGGGRNGESDDDDTTDARYRRRGGWRDADPDDMRRGYDDDDRRATGDAVRHGYGRRPPGMRRGRMTRDSVETVEEMRERHRREEEPLLDYSRGNNRDGGRGGTTRAMVGDSTSLDTEWNHMVATAALLVPNVSAPTLDHRTPARKSHETMCDFRKNTLTDAYKDQNNKVIIDSLLGSAPATFSSMTCDMATMLFNGAGEMAKQRNNRAMFVRNPSGGVRSAGGGIAHKRPTAAAINTANAEFWAKQGGNA